MVARIDRLRPSLALSTSRPCVTASRANSRAFACETRCEVEDSGFCRSPRSVTPFCTARALGASLWPSRWSRIGLFCRQPSRRTAYSLSSTLRARESASARSIATATEATEKTSNTSKAMSTPSWTRSPRERASPCANRWWESQFIVGNQAAVGNQQETVWASKYLGRTRKS
jgi:hypothetical protein